MGLDQFPSQPRDAGACCSSGSLLFLALGRCARSWAGEYLPWTNVYGLARTLLAAATALTLLFSRVSTLFRSASGMNEIRQCEGIRHIGLFCLFPTDDLEIARWLAVALLLITASGWRPRFTAIPHWWVSFSLLANAVVLDGGDSVAAVLTLLLLPTALTDPRDWHWQSPRQIPGRFEEIRRVVALVSLTFVRIQVAGIYFHAAIGKFSVDEWMNGTELYYVFTHPLFGAADWLKQFLTPLLRNGAILTTMTYSVLIAEYLLSTGLFVAKKHRSALLVAGICLHLGILVIHGLVTFSLAMFAALLLYLRPIEREFRLPAQFLRLRGRLVDLMILARSRRSSPYSGEPRG